MPKKIEPPTNDEGNHKSNSQTTEESNSQYESPSKKTKVESKSEALNFTYRVQEINGQAVAVVLIAPTPTYNKHFQYKFSYPFGSCKHTTPQCQNCYKEILSKLSFKLSSQEFENFNGQINADHYVNEIPTPFETIPPDWG